MRPVKLLTIALILAGIFFLNKATAQIKIGTNGANIQPSSLLELESANQGFLLPRMANTIAIDALNPPNGMMIYKTTDPAGLYIRKNNQWEYITGSMNGDAVFNSVTVTGPVTAVSFSGPLNGNATSANTATTANNSLSSTVTNDLSTSQPSYPIFVTQTPGITPLRTSTTKLSFVPNTGILTAVGFNGPLVGDVTGNASSATNATNASNTDISDDISTAAVHYPTFVSGITGNLPHRTSSTNLSYTPSTGELKAVRFLGNLTGNASSSDNAITTTITNDNVSASLVYPTLVTNSSGNWGQRTANTRLTFVPSTGLLTAGSFTSTIPTGTAPLTVASTTTVANLGATNTLNTNITDDVATTSSVYPTFVTATSGNQNQRTASSRLSFIPSTGALTASSFVGPLNGNATSATTAVDATNSANSAISNDITTPTVAYPVFVNGSPGNQPLRVGTTNMSYVPSTGILTARGFVGPLTGNVTGTATASLDAENTVNMRVTDDVISATPFYPVLVTGTSGPLPPKTSGTKLSFTPSTGELVAPTFRGALAGNANTATTVTGTVAAVNGGTGNVSYSPGDLLYASTSTALSKLAIGAPNTVLRVSAGNMPVWSTGGAGTVTGVTGAANKISVTDNFVAPIIDIATTYAGQNSINTVGTITTGVWNGSAVPVASGGTGLTTLPTGLLVGNGTSAVTTVTGQTGYVLTSTGTGLPPIFQASGGGDMILASTQSVTGAKTFDYNRLITTGVSGRTATIIASTGVGSSSVELPPDGIIVNRDRTETLTNKTLTSPILVTPNLGAATGTSVTTTGNVTASRLVSNIADGTAPLVVTSLTPVANLSIGGNAATATTANNFSGSLVGDVTGTQGATVVSSVAGFSSSTIFSRLTTVGDATSGNTANTLVLRAAGGNFTAGVISATGFVGPLTGSITGNAATVTTNANLTGEATSIGNAVTLANAAVIAKTLTGFVSGSGSITAADNILAAIQKLNGNIGLKANIDNPVFTTGITTPLLTLGATALTSTAARLNYLDQVAGRTGTVTSNVVLSESPTLTGTPTAPNPLAGDNTAQIATTQFVTTADNLKANIASPTFTGIPAAPTAAALTSTTQLATTEFVTTANNLKANIASPTFTGTVTTPAFVISTLSAPASNAPGTAGEIRIAAGFIYVCIASGNWQRATLVGGY